MSSLARSPPAPDAIASGDADAIASGDADVLVLGAHEGIAMLRVDECLAVIAALAA